MLDNTKAQKEILEMFREVGKARKKSFSSSTSSNLFLVPLYPLVKEMFPEELKQDDPLGGRISHFVQSWKNITKDQVILEIVKGFKISLLRTPVQEEILLNITLKKTPKFLVEKGLKEILKKGTIKNNKDQHAQNQFLRNFFLVGKNDDGNRPVVNLKSLSQFVPYMPSNWKVCRL